MIDYLKKLFNTNKEDRIIFDKKLPIVTTKLPMPDGVKPAKDEGDSVSIEDLILSLSFLSLKSKAAEIGKDSHYYSMRTDGNIKIIFDFGPFNNSLHRCKITVYFDSVVIYQVKSGDEYKFFRSNMDDHIFCFLKKITETFKAHEKNAFKMRQDSFLKLANIDFNL